MASSSSISRFIERFREQPRPPRFYEQQQQRANNGPWGQGPIITQVGGGFPSSTVGFHFGGGETIELDVTPLNRFISNLFPFVIETSFLRVNKFKYSDGRDKFESPKIKFIVSPAHRAELYDEDIEDKVKAYIRTKLRPLLVSMYEVDGMSLEIHFGSQRWETILEYLKDE